MSYLHSSNSRNICLALMLTSACATGDSGVPSEGFENEDGHDRLIMPATGEDASASSDEAEGPQEATGGADDGTDDTVLEPSAEDQGASAASSTGSPKPNTGTSAPVSNTMYVKGRQLYTSCGEEVVLRGVNH